MATTLVMLILVTRVQCVCMSREIIVRLYITGFIEEEMHSSEHNFE